MPESPPYNRVSMKAAHNSIDKALPVSRQLAWDPAAPHHFGCRGLELDLVQAATKWEWAVKHGGSYSAQSRQLAETLEEIGDWSEANAGHDVVTVHLDLKNVPVKTPEFPEALDRCIRDHFPWRRIFRPRHLLLPGGDLVASAMQHGWPSLDDLSRKFIFCLTGSETGKALYADHKPADRLCFADVEVASSANPWTPSATRGNRVFFNIWANPFGDQHWPGTVAWYARRRGFITRLFVVNTPARWRLAVGARANVIATDRLTDATWAHVGGTPFGAF